MSQALYPAASNRFLDHQTREGINGAQMKPPAIEYFYLAMEAVPSVKPITGAIAPDLPSRHDLMFFVRVEDGRGRNGVPIHHIMLLIG